MSKMMSLLRQEFSPDIYFYAGKKVLDSNKEKSIVFDGIRKLYFIEYLKTQTKCIVVYRYRYTYSV